MYLWGAGFESDTNTAVKIHYAFTFPGRVLKDLRHLSARAAAGITDDGRL